TLANDIQLVGVFLAAHVGKRVDDDRSIRIADTIVNPQAAALGIDRAQGCQLTWTISRRLAVIPGDHTPLFDMRLLDTFRQTILINELGVAILADNQVAAKTRA